MGALNLTQEVQSIAREICSEADTLIRAEKAAERSFQKSLQAAAEKRDQRIASATELLGEIQEIHEVTVQTLMKTGYVMNIDKVKHLVARKRTEKLRAFKEPESLLSHIAAQSRSILKAAGYASGPGLDSLGDSLLGLTPLATS